MFTICEDYLDAEHKFYDYHTKAVSGSNCFDTSTTGMSGYDDFLSDPEYMIKSRNLKHTIVQMTPTQYFEGCAKIFDSTTEKQIAQTSADKNTIHHLTEVIKKYKRCFPLTYLNYAQSTQEGRHRMYVAGELFGWDTKHPVMVVEWADAELARKKQKQQKQASLNKDVRIAVENTLHYKYNDMDEFWYQLQSELNNQINGYDYDAKDVKFSVSNSEDAMTITCNGGTYTFNPEDIQFKDSTVDTDHFEIDDDILIDDDTDIDALLAKYL